MSNYKPYPKYKPSGVEWLGDVPEGWIVSRIKNVATINASKSEVSHLDPETEISFLPMEAVGDDGSLDTSTTRQLGDVLTGYTYVRENDVLVAKITPCFENGKGCIARGLNNGIGFATTEVVPIRPNKRSVPEFLYFLLHGLPFRKVAEGSMYGAGGQKRVSDTFVAGYSFALPPLPEQHQIATFLDRECGKLDALQAKQERLIELLKEKRQALISHAVTRGLDPTAKLKPSGIEWLGDVPEGWCAPYFGMLIAKAELGGNYDGSEGGDGIPLIKMGNLDRGFIKTNKVECLPEGQAYDRAFVLKDGDFLFNTRNSLDLVGKVAVWRGELPLAIYNSNILRITFRKQKVANSAFMSYFFNSDLGVSQLRLVAKGTTSVAAIYYKDLTTLRITIPPLAEQRAIVAHLDEKCGKIDELKAKAERGIELLKERRSALISAAVTGKIDVREI